MKTMSANRCEWLDCAKGIAILLVVLGHSFQYYLYPDGFENTLPWRIVYSFHMPFFFMLSGFSSGFSKYSKFSNFTLHKKINRLVIPYFSWGLILFPISLFYRGWSWNLITDFVVKPSHVGLWYLWTLFFIWLLHSLILRLFKGGGIRQLICVIVWLTLILFAYLTSGICCFNEISNYFVFYVIGFELCKNKLITPPQTAKNPYYLKRILWGISCFSCYFYFQQYVDWWDWWITIKGNKYILGLIGSYVFINVACYISFKISGLSRLLQKYGEKTLGIYALDTYIIIAAAMLFNRTPTLYPLALLLDIIGSFILTGLLSKYTITSRFLLGENK